MTRRKTILLVALVSLITVTGTFAAGVQDKGGVVTRFTASTLVTSTPYLAQHFEAPDSVKAIFIDGGVDAAYLTDDLGKIPYDVRDSIDSIYSDNKDTIDAAVRSELTSRIQTGKVEFAYTIIGRLKWTVAASWEE